MASSNQKTLGQNLSKLRLKVEAVLADSKDGVKLNSFWNDFKTKHGELPEPKNFGFAKRTDLLNCFSDLFVTVENSKGEKLLRLGIESQVYESSGKKTPLVSKVGAKPVQAKSKAETKPDAVVKSVNREEVQGLRDIDAMSRKLPGNDFYGRYYGRQDVGPYQRGNLPQQGAPITGNQAQGLLPTAASVNPGANYYGQVPGPYVQPPFNYPFQTMPQTAVWQRTIAPNIAAQTNLNINQSNSVLNAEDFPLVGSASADQVAKSSGAGKNVAISTQKFAPAAKSTKRMHFSRDQMNAVAEDCIERLSESKDYVSLERIKKLFLQHYTAESLDQLGLRNMEELKCVFDHVRMECKVNLYIQMFVKTRAICTICELGECLREYAPNRQDFETVRLGPLIKMPLVYEQFLAPQDKDLCEIRTAEILEYLRGYLTENNLWTDNKASLEDFLTFMMNKRGLTTPFELGVRIKSLPLAIQVLKKGQRDCGQAIRDAVQRLRTAVENDVDTAFRHFSSSILLKETGLCQVRQQYLKMPCHDALNAIFAKLKLLYQTVTEHEHSWDCAGVKLTGMAKSRREFNKTQTTINEFRSLLSKDVLLQKFMHLAICCSPEEIHQQMSDLFPQRKRRTDDSSDSSSDESEDAIPKKDEVVASIKKYMERCIAHGSLTLEKLSKIEERLIEDFKLHHFNDIKQGGFLQFLLKTEEIKKHLDESGGTLLGSSSHGVGAESCFHAGLDDLLEFVAQCAFKEQTQQRLIEMAICHHYSVREVRSLGHGAFANLVKMTEKQQRIGRGSGVYYASALVAKNFPAVLASDRSTGPLGHKTKDQALACLQSCPLLEDMSSWSHWDLVFKPELKELKDFVQKYGGAQMIPVTDGAKKKMMSTCILALEVRPGTLLKLTSDTSTEKFAAAAAARDVTGTCGHLVSLLTVNHGLDGVPLALLGNSFETALHKIRAALPNEIGPLRMRGQKDPSTDMILFTLDCIVKVPLIIGHRVIEEVFLRPLRDIVGKVKCEEQLLAITQTMEQKSQLQVLGILLGIREWSESFQERLRAPADCVKEIDTDLTEIIDLDETSSEVEDSKSDTDFSLSEDEDEDDEEDDEEPKKAEAGVVKKQNPVAITSNESKDSDPNKPELDSETACVKLDDDAEREVQMIVEPINVDLSMAGEDPVNAKEAYCQALIDRIRQEEFGFNVELNEDGTKLLTKQQERLGRSLERLSKDLYSKDTHFVLELIQNADDNEYTEEMLRSQSDVTPSVQFHVDHDTIIVYNNEVGFQEKNIRAICDVGRTTKGKHKFGYIGQKGIGFKSVFRITDLPEIHSNGYHIRFDANSKPLGYILPQWISKDNRAIELPENWMTCIALPLKQEMQDDHHTLSLAARFRDIHPSLLLFLHRLRSIEVVNKVEDYTSKMTRIDVSDSITEIQHRDGVDRWLVVRKTLDASQISLQAKSGIEVESTEIALAFPMISKADIAAQVLPPRQPVFAFLPLRSYGFRFVVQADFDVPSSREEVDRDSMWNQWLRNEIHSVFVNALEDFKNHADFNEIEAVSYFLQFVPHQDEILDFFRPVASNILYQLKAKPCLPTQGLQWKLPSQLLICDDPMVREVISNSHLKKHLGLEYLHRDVAARLNPHMLQSLGVQSLTTQHLIEVGKSIVANLNSKESNGEIAKASKWLLCIYKSMDEFRANDDILASLRCLPMIPLTNGEIVSLDLQTVFFPLSTLENDATRKNHLLRLESDMRTVHPLLLGTPENVASSQICSLLQQLGVKKLTPSEVIQHHILPSLRSQNAENKSRDLLVTYILYIKEHCSLVNMDELKDTAILLTNHGPKRPNTESVHFTEAYFNVNLPQVLPGYPWVLLDSCYLQGSDGKRQIHEWKDFMGRLGVTDLLAVRQKKLILKKSELAKSPWSSYEQMLPPLDEYHILDSECEEFEALVLRNAQANSLMSQMSRLFELIDSTWDSTYKRHSVTQITNSLSQPVKEVETSFSMLLKSLKWIPSKLEGTPHLAKGCDLFVESQDTQRLMAGHVSYIIPPVIKTSSFARHLDIQYKINIEFVISQLLRWSARSSPESRKPATFSTSIAHMKYIYEYLIDNLPPRRVQELFDHPVIYVPAETGSEGHFMARQEVRWFDPSGLFDRYRDSLSSFDDDINGFRVNLKLFYQGLDHAFVNVARVQARPDIVDYTELLIQISLTCNLQRALPDVLHIFSIIGKELTDGEELATKSQLEKAVALIKPNKAIPSKRGRWVGLEDNTMVADDRQLEKLFADKEELNFVDCGDKLGVGGTRVIKDLEGINLDYVIKFLTSVGVEKLSSCVSTTSQTEMYHPCPSLQMYVRDVIPFIQRMVYCSSTIYDYLVKEKSIKNKLATMQFAQVSKLDLIHSLRNVPDMMPVIFPQKCSLLNDQEMYVHRDFVDSYNDINRELARYFSCTGIPCPDEVAQSSENCFLKLKSFLGEILPIIQSKSQALDDLMEEHNLLAFPKDEEPWEVREPFVLISHGQPDPVMQADITEMKVTNESEEMADGSGESSGLKSWPPQAPSSRAQSGLRPSSNVRGPFIWPPPDAPQYRDHSQLPANLRPSTLDRGEPGQQEQIPDNGSQEKTDGQHKELKRDDSCLEMSDKAVKHMKPKDDASGPVIRTEHVASNESVNKKHGQEEVGGANVTPKKEPQSENVDMQETLTSKLEAKVTETKSPMEELGSNHPEQMVIEFSMPSMDVSTVMRAGHKRARVSSGSTSNDLIRPHTKQMITSHFYGPPIWLAQTDENVFDHLGSADGLPLPHDVTISEDSDTTAIGIWGELLVKNFLEKCRSDGTSDIIDVVHCNSGHETGLPYDFVVKQQCGDAVTEVYIEVKTTVSNSKACFQISLNQLLFAQQQGQSYHLYRVYSAGNPKETSLSKIMNLREKMLLDQVRLMMII